MTPRYRPNAFATKQQSFGRGGVIWRVRSEYDHAMLGAAVIQHAYAARWTHLIGANLRQFCQQHDVTGYDRFRGVLRGDIVMRDEDRARMLAIFGLDATIEVAEIADRFQEVYEDTGVRLIAPKPRRTYIPSTGEFRLEAVEAGEHPPVGQRRAAQPSSMTTSTTNDPLFHRLKTAAEAIYRAHDPTPIRRRLIEVDRDPQRDPSLTGSIYGYFGGGGLVITAYPGPEDTLDIIDGVLILAVHERDETGRPLRVDGLRAVPERLVRDPADIAWEFAASPARVYYSGEHTLIRWDEPDLDAAGLQWAAATCRDY